MMIQEMLLLVLLIFYGVAGSCYCNITYMGLHELYCECGVRRKRALTRISWVIFSIFCLVFSFFLWPLVLVICLW
jgi:TM2 domain-containing membrane protein YozV